MSRHLGPLRRRLRSLQRTLCRTFPTALTLFENPRLAEHIDSHPADHAAAATLRALEDLLDELTPSPLPKHVDHASDRDDNIDF